jgi:hypothetical protein
MELREHILGQIGLHRNAVARHLKNGKSWAAEAAQKCLAREEAKLKRLDQESNR